MIRNPYVLMFMLCVHMVGVAAATATGNIWLALWCIAWLVVTVICIMEQV